MSPDPKMSPIKYVVALLEKNNLKVGQPDKPPFKEQKKKR
jgi:hypothetical protein